MLCTVWALEAVPVLRGGASTAAKPMQSSDAACVPCLWYTESTQSFCQQFSL